VVKPDGQISSEKESAKFYAAFEGLLQPLEKWYLMFPNIPELCAPASGQAKHLS
jgi:hypothetical protein